MQRPGSRMASPRRNKAPARPVQAATTVPDLLFAMAMTGWSMGLIFTVASFVDRDVTAGAAGVALARLFSAALAVCGLFAFLLGLVLLRGERSRADHYVTPAIVGALIGASEAVLFLWPSDRFLILPLIFIVFALRPVRRLIAGVLRPTSGHRG